MCTIAGVLTIIICGIMSMRVSKKIGDTVIESVLEPLREIETVAGELAKMVNPNVSAVESISGMLAGKLADDYDAKMLREERLAKYAVDD